MCMITDDNTHTHCKLTQTLQHAPTHISQLLNSHTSRRARHIHVQAVVCRDGGGAEPELKDRARTGGAGGMLTAEQTTETSAAERRAGPAVKCILM